MKKLFILLPAFLVLFLGSAREVKAQCSGTVDDSYTRFTCDPNCGVTGCNPQCVGSTVSNVQQCHAVTSSGGTGCLYDYVRRNNICVLTPTGCNISSSPALPIPDGAVCPSNGGGPNPTPPPGTGGCTTGDCFPGIGNCGEVGRDPGSGSCSGGLCCVPKTGGGPCTVEFQSVPTLSVGESGIIQAFARGGIEWWDGNWSFIGTSLGTFTPQVDTLGAIYTTTFTATQAGVSTVNIRVTEDNNGAFQCQGSVPIIVSDAVPTCTISLNPDPLQVVVGQDRLLSASVNSSSPISQVNFSVSNPAIASATPTDSIAPYTSTVSGLSQGTTNVTATALIGGVPRCTDQARIISNPPNPWWQVRGGDVVSGGNLVSLIPTQSCQLPGCTPYLIRDETSGYPGVAIHEGPTADFDSAPSSTGEVSSKGWISRTVAPNFTYQYFESLIPTSAQFTNLSGSISGTELASGGVADSYSFYWYRSAGSLTINQNITFPAGRKVILFVNGNLTLNGRINIPNRNSFFMAIVNGNINVASQVTNGNNPALEGVYFAQNQFSTGTTGADDSVLRVRGAVYANSVRLQRDLEDENADSPAESFEYGKEILLNYHPSFSQKKLIWQEINP